MIMLQKHRGYKTGLEGVLNLVGSLLEGALGLVGLSRALGVVETRGDRLLGLLTSGLLGVGDDSFFSLLEQSFTVSVRHFSKEVAELRLIYTPDCC